jgi:isopenicillin-N N-acyltransferase-like protein
MESPTIKKYDILEVRGQAYDRGFSYGQHHADRLRRLLKSHYEFYARYLETSKEEVLRDASKYEKPIRDYSELVADELQGTADGAGVKLDEVMMITAFNEVFYPKLAKSCTSFAVRDGATSDGLTYVGQNNDEGVDPWLNGDCTTLTKFAQSDAPDALIYTYVGAPALMGINSSGLSICVNALAYSAPRLGVPLLAVVREVLNQKSLEGALEQVERAKRSYAINFVVGNPEGIMDLETYPDRVFVRRSEEMVWHTNHCIYAQGLRYENDDYRANSVARCERIDALLSEHKGKLDLKTLQGFLSDHKNRPNSICWHVDESKPRPQRTKTLDSMVYIPEKREAWIASGNPCENAFVRYTI